jgi:hypothetical protein
MLRLVAAGAASAAMLALTLPAGATAPPVGPLPQGPTTTVRAHTGSLVAVALPHRTGGLVWRLARGVSPRVLVQVSEADVGKDVVLVYRATRPGHAKLAFGLTRGETSRARASLTFDVTILRSQG